MRTRDLSLTTLALSLCACSTPAPAPAPTDAGDAGAITDTPIVTDTPTTTDTPTMDAVSDANVADTAPDAPADVPRDVAPDVAPDAPSDVPTDAGVAHDTPPAPDGNAVCPPGTCIPPSGSACEMPTGPTGNACCMCGNDGRCSSPCRCAAPDTPIATPDGERPIASLRAGDLVYSVDRGRLRAVPLRAVQRIPVRDHRVVRVALRGGAVLHISGGHPTADGRSFADLHAGAWLGGREVVSSAVVDYPHDATYDILPDSDTATYVAAGALIGSTMAPVVTRREDAPACRPAVAVQ